MIWGHYYRDSRRTRRWVRREGNTMSETRTVGTMDQDPQVGTQQD